MKSVTLTLNNRAFFAAVAMTMVVVCIGLVMFFRMSSTEVPQVKKGRLDLSNWDFIERGNLPLDGEWEFYWKRFLIGKNGEREAHVSSSDIHYINLPDTWNGYNYEGEKLKGHGWASYRLVVDLKTTDQILSVKVMPMSTSYELWVDGELVSSAGKLGTNAKDAEPTYVRRTSHFTPKGKQVEFVLQVSNFSHRAGGVWESMTLGEIDKIALKGDTAKAFDWIVTTALVVLAIYHFVVLFQRRDVSEAFYLAGFCIVMAVRVLFTSERILYNAFEGINWEFFHKLEYLTVMVSCPLILSFAQKLFPDEVKMAALRICYLYAIVNTLIVVVTTASVYSWIIVPFEIFFILMGVYCFYATTLAIFRNRSNARLMFIGLIAAFTLGVNDVLYQNRIIDTTELFDIGILIIASIQTFILSRIFVQALIDSKRYSRELADKNKILDASNRQKEIRSIELEKQLYRSQKLEAIGTLTGGIAHDFNNILGTMLGYIELLIDSQSMTPEEKSYLEEIYKAGERAADLVKQVLTFSRSNESDLEPIELVPVVKDALKMLRATIPSSIEVRQDIHEDSGYILSNATQLHQIIVNLITNAYQAIGDEPGLIDVSLKKVKNLDTGPLAAGLKEGVYVELMVSDNGEGMTRADQERIFDPFFTTKDIGSGTGLGLSVVHGIVKNHSGEIIVDSELGVGTTFRLFFPYLEEASARKTLEADNVPAEGKGHILVVDDEVSLSQFYRLALMKLGYQVTLMNSGVEAIERLKTCPDDFVLVFTDQSMPKLTGIQLGLKVKLINPDIPVILATGYISDELTKKAAEIGIKTILEKPIKLSDLAMALQDNLN